jgi:hypothetical protein
MNYFDFACPFHQVHQRHVVEPEFRLWDPDLLKGHECLPVTSSCGSNAAEHTSGSNCWR